jgi:hypothetical protein
MTRAHALARASLLSDSSYHLTHSPTLKKGEWVVHLMPEYEKKIKKDLSKKFTSVWSLPSKVIEIKDKVTTVESLFSHRQTQVPLSKIRVLQGVIPVSLQDINLRQLETYLPQSLQDVQRRHLSSSIPWSEFLERPAVPPSVPTTSAAHSTRPQKRFRSEDQ